MVLIVAGLAAACIVLLLMASLVSRLRQVYVRDSLWARLWSRAPWKAEPIAIPAEAPDLLSLFVRSFAASEAPAETVAEVRFSVSGAGLRGIGPAGTYVAVLAFPHGTVLCWRARRAAIPRSGFTCRDENRILTRGWAFGVVPTAWRNTGAADVGALDTTLLSTTLEMCWTPAAIVRNGEVQWSAAGATLLSAAFPAQPGKPVARIRFSQDGRPEELSVSSGNDPQRATIDITMSDFADFDGYRLPRLLESSGFGRVDRNLAIRLESLRYSGAWSDRHRK